MTQEKKYVLQLCHGYATPFTDVARQYASLFNDTDYHVVTVYLTGEANDNVIIQSASDTVLFLENNSNDIKGLKLKQIKQVKQLHAHYHFEFIIAHRYKPIYIACHLKGISVIGIHHAFDIYNRFMRCFFASRHQKQLFLLGVSNAIRDDIRKHLPSFPQQKIQTLYNRINSEQLKAQQLDRSSARQKLDLPHDHYIFANVGRLHPDKDQKVLIDAFAKIANDLPDSLLVILGKGKLEQKLKQQASQLGLTKRVLFLGMVPNAVQYFRAFDSFVLSSNFEPFGMVLLEAIIADLPVIATKAGGAEEIITKSDWLFNVGDSDRLSTLMIQVYGLSQDEKKAINQENMQWLEANFTDQAVKNTFWNLACLAHFKR